MSNRSLKTPPKTDKTASEPEAAPLPSPEDESHLAGRSTAQAEQLIALFDNGVPIYLFSRISSGHSAQSDFFRIQFVTYARAEGNRWLPLSGEASEWMATRNCLQVAVDHPSQTVSFGPKSGFSLSPEIAGLGLSGYAYSQAINWLKQRYPDYRVLPSVLPAPEAEGEEARAHRNSRLAAHGFDFEWDDSTQVHGRYYKARVRQLISGWDSAKVTEISLSALLGTMSRHDEEHAELQQKLHGLQTQERSLETSLHKEKQTNLLLTGITCFVLIFSLLGALGFY